jgi:serine protease Do
VNRAEATRGGAGKGWPVRYLPRSGPRATALLLVLLLIGMIGGAAPASAAPDQDEWRPLVPRRIFDQSRPGVELITAEFTGQVEVPEPRITPADQIVLRARVQRRIDQGEISDSETAKRDAAAEEIVEDPVRWLTPGDVIDRLDLEIQAMGSGFSISADGYIVTNAHVVAPQYDALKATALLRHELSSKFQDAIDHLIQGGVSGDQEIDLMEAGWQWAVVMSKIGHFKRQFRAVTPSGSGGAGSPADGRPAKLVRAGQEFPGKDVAILKVDAHEMATVALGDDTALSTGDRLFVLGFPGPATFSPVLSKESQKEPTLTQGVLSAKKQASKGFTLLQTDAAMTHGNSGGPVFDEQGKVVGVATFGSVDPQTGREVAGLNFAVPVSVVNELLAQARVTPVEGTATRRYRLGLDAFDRHWYKRALPLFMQAQRLDPEHPSVGRLIKQSQDAIAQGHDRTPRTILGLEPRPLGAVAAGALLLLALALLLARARRRRRARRARAVPGVPPLRRDTHPQMPAAAAPPPSPPTMPVSRAWWPQQERPAASAEERDARTLRQPPIRSGSQEAAPLHCWNCGRPNAPTNRFCEGCWTVLGS